MTVDLSDEELESLRTVAQSHLPANWIAQRLLQAQGEISYEPKGSEETDVTPTPETENDSQGVFTF
jgi:hypothetical protein